MMLAVVIVVGVLAALAIIGWRSGGPWASRMAREAQRHKEEDE
jgi:hypothetical protein